MTEPNQKERKQRNEIFGGPPSTAQMEKETGYKIPVESVPLPSKGIVYPEENVLHKKDSIDIRSMTVADEDILNSRAYAKKGITISKLLESCITEPGVNLKEMISADRNSLIVSLRIISYGADYSASVQCEECGARNDDYEFNLSRLPFKTLKIEPISIGTNKFGLTLPSGRNVVLRFLTGQQEEEIMQIAEKSNKNRLPDNNLVSTRLKYSVVSLDGETDRLKLDRMIRGMPTIDSAAIHKFFEKNEPGVDLTAEFECRECDANRRIGVPMNASFFRGF